MPSAPVVIVMTSNGVGMGHLSRQLATVLSAGTRMRAVVLSLSGALPRIMAADAGGELEEAADLGIRYEYCPSWESPWLTVPGRPTAVNRALRYTRWAPYLRERVIALARETGASALVFDGVAPYRGLLQARAALPSVRFAWVRRGMWRPGAPARRLDAARHFDLTIEPGDVAAAYDRGPTAGRSDATPVTPVSLTAALRTSTRDEARAALGLPAEGPVLLLAPGSGALGSVDAAVAAVLDEVRANAPDWHVALTRQAIARHGDGGSAGPGRGITVLDDVYPLARHLAAFDAAVGAAGYNAVHELTASGVPSLFLPSTRHATDDQEARARGLADLGAALVSDGTDLPVALARLVDEDVRAGLAAASRALPQPHGASQIADLAVGLATDGAPDGGPLDTRRPSRSPLPLPAGGELTSEIDGATVRAGRPVEHVLAGSSPEYQAVRRRAAEWVYRSG